MSLLYILENIRTGVGDFLMATVTRFGEESLFIILALLFLWCIDKKEGYYILTVGFFGLLFNQFLKILCRVPRPWVKDPAFTVVEGTKEAATGYSFPSGHTQTAVGAYGAVARYQKQKWVRGIMIALCVLVPFSRMYLGVHTPLDVGVSILIALTLVFGLYPIFKTLKEHPYRLLYLLAGLLLLSIGFVLYVELGNFSGVDTHNYESAVKNAYTLLGSLLGFILIYLLDVCVYRYETKAPLLAQILKLAVGAGLVILIKSFLKAPLLSLFGGHHIADAVRYFLMFAVAGGICPMLFPYFTKFALWVKRKLTREKA